MQAAAAPRARAALLTQAQSTAAAQPLSLVTGDVNEDGVPDLLVGYSGYVSIQPGNLDAFAPQSDESFQAIAHGQFPAPFLPQGLQIATPVNPDFIAVGHFTASGHNDLVIAAKGGTALYVFAGDGLGNFAPPQTLNLPGGVTVMAGGDLGHASGFNQIIAGLSAPSGPELAIFSGSKDGLDAVAAFPLSGPASNLNFGDFGDGGTDLAFLAGGKVEILRASTMQLQPVSLPISAVALAVGNFVTDRVPGLQLALLTADGSIHIAAHSEFDPRAYSTEEVNAVLQSRRMRTEANPLLPARSFPVNGWKIVEDTNAAATFAAGQPPVMFRTRISDHQMDDIMVLNGSTGLLTVIQHPDAQPGQIGFAPAVLSTRPYSGSPLAAIPQRVNVDGRAGVLVIHQGESAPSMLMPLPDPTFFPNRFDDITPRGTAVTCLNTVGVDGSGDCTLREAIIKANSISGADTIMLQAGTYTLTQPRSAADHHTSLQGTLEVQDSLTIVGAGQNATIIQGGTNLTTSVDKVFSFNQDIDSFTNATVSVSNLTIQNGHNRGDCCTLQDGFGGAFDFDTGGNGTPGSGNATLTMQNVTIQNNAVFDGQGGGFTMFNTLNGTGFATLSNVIVQNNDATANATGCCGDGGGGVIDARSHVVMTNVQVLNNHTHTNAGTNPTGGGLFFSGQHTQPQSHISGGAISGNTAAGIGGGINSIATLLIDGGTVISNNTAGTDANFAGGGGIRNDAFDGLTLSKVTITGNSTTGNGGGIYTGDGSGIGSVTINFSRLAGNTSTHSAGGNELFNVTATSPGNTGNPVTATNDWWGTNMPSGVISQNGSAAVSACPVASPANAVCFDPYIVLTHQASPAIIRINQSTTLTADMSKDNHGNGAALVGNLNQIVGLPITFDTPFLGTIPQAQPETLNANAQATATFNAGNTSGRGSANATVDQAVVSANSNLIASATEAGTTATITTVGTHNFSTGETVVISGVGVGGYNGTFVILSTPTSTTFTYTAPGGLGASSGGTASVGIIILEPLKITKSFAPTTVGTNTASTITFSITNPNVMPVDSNFTDNLPANVGTVPGSLVVAPSPSVVNTCGGTVTAVAGSGSLSFSNASLPVGACSIKVNVQSSVDNTYSNTVTINSTQAGTGAQSTSSANLLVINPPSINKVFGATTIPLNGTSSLTFTISSTNQNETLNATSFTDSLPAGLVVATPSSLNTTCTGTATAVAASSSVSLSAASLAPGTSCTVSLNVQGTTAGLKNNSVTVSDTTAGTGNTSTASITVVAPPTISKAFGAASIPLNGTTTLTFTISNPNTTAAGDLTGVAFSDTLPSTTGTLVVAATPGVVNTCNGTVTATAGTGVISLSGGTVAHNASCTLSVNVTGTAAGDAVNTTGAITSTEGGTGTTSNTATLKVVAPPTISKAFGAASIPLNGTTTVTFTITNPAANTTSEVGIAISDTLTNGLQVGSTPGVSNSCGGTVTAAANSTLISLTGGSIPTPGTTCTVVVNVTGTQAGTVTNTTGAVSSTNGGTGATSNTANLTVVAPPVAVKVFNPTTIPLNGTTTLTFTITNPSVNTVALSPVTLIDPLPSGLTTPNKIVSDPCGLGSGALTVSSNTISLGGVTIPANGQCVYSVTVTGATAGQFTNTTGHVSSANGGTGNTTSANLTVIAPPTIAKAFGAASIPLNGTTTVTFTISNPNTTAAGDLTGVAFSDTLPNTTGTLVVAATPAVVNTCGGTVTATAGTGVISLSGGAVAHNSSCSLAVNVTGTAAGDANNTTGAISSTEGGTGLTSNTALLKVVAPPTISKAFGATNITLNGTTTVTFTITNPAANTSAQTGIAFSDTLTNGLQVASTPGVSNTCGGTVTAAANSASISLTGGSIATPGSTCTIVVNVTGTQSGTVTNTTGAVSSTNGGTGATSNTATLIVASPATVAKSFGAAKIPLNGTTSLTINITNPNTNVSLTGLSFTDNLPAGLVIAATPNLTNTCGGTATATAGSGSLSLSGGTLAATASCVVTVNVQGTTAGDKGNSVQVTSAEGGTSVTATAALTVVAPPTISKAFGAASIPLNGTTTVTFTISNPNNPGTPANGDLTGVAFSDTLPSTTGTLVVAATPGVNTCNGTVTATAGTGVITLSGGSVAHNSSCTLTVNVTGTAAGDAANTTGPITSTEGGTGATSNTATISVEAPPSIAKTFAPSAISLNSATSLTFTITNPAANISALTGVAFTDTLPTGLTVTNSTATVCGGTLTTTAPTGIALSGATVAVNSQCQFIVTVTGAASGQYTNTTGNVTSTNGGTGNTASANLTVATPPSVQKAFGALSIPLNGTTSLTFTIANPNTNLALTGLAFTDNLPAGLVVASTPNLSNTCGGTATAAAGSGSVSLSAGTLATSASCTVSLQVQGTTAGVKNNNVTVTSTETGPSNTASASITVSAPPSLVKAFGAGSIPLNGSTSLSFTIQNSNTTTAMTGVAFSDTLPAGLVISTPNGFTGSCGAGTVTATAGTNAITLAGGTLAANASCTFSVNVTGIAAGTQNNTTSNVSSNEGGTGGPATASINVVAPPTIAKVFNPANIALNATTSLTFTITNPAANAVALTGVAFTDTLPTGLSVANASATVCGGTLTTTAPTGIALTGATISPSSQCQFSVTVTGAAAGQYTNTTGNVTSTNGGTGNTASANLSVATAPTITKAFGAASILLNANTSLTFNINNPNTTIALSGVAFSDALPAGLVVATPSGLTSTCGGMASAAAGSSSISLSGGALAANGSCSISLNVTGVTAGVQNNTTGPISSTESGAGAPSNTASLTVIAPPSIAKAFGAANINLNAATTLSFTITNPNATVALTGVGVSDTLPAGLVVASPSGLTGSCGSGTITTSASSVNLSAGTIAAGGSCTFSANVVGTTAGHKVNTTSTVSTTNAGSGNQATASIDVFAPDTAISKTHTGTFTRGQTGAQWVITVSNVGFGPTSGTVTVVDTLPNVVNPPVPTAMTGTGWTCTLATLTCTRADALPSGSRYPPITLTVNIPKNIQNTFTNTATVSGGGDVNPNDNTATDKISLGPPIVLTPQSGTLTISHGGTGQIVISVDAPDPTLGKITFSCSGLPDKSACDFSPASIDPAVTPGPTNVAVFIATAKGSASLFAPQRPGRQGHAPMYAMLSLPVFGIMLAGFGDQRRKGAKRWAVLVLLGLLCLLAMAGCGTASPQPPPPLPGTPAGTYAVTVTATSTGATATATFNMVVQ